MNEEFQVCPFNKAHVMKTSRIQSHITKCKKTYTGCKIPCPFNACEYIEPGLMGAHLEECIYRKEQECRAWNSRKDTYMVQKIEAPFVHKGAPEPEENWGVD